MSNWTDKIVCVSGGFDPITIGHIRYIKAAAEIGRVTVILNSDEFLIKKKGYAFMPEQERKEILDNIKGVHSVMMCIDDDMTVCKTLEVLLPDIFAKGGDRILSNTPERKFCAHNGIKVVYGVGGTDKPQSSSWLIDRAIKQKEMIK